MPENIEIKTLRFGEGMLIPVLTRNEKVTIRLFDPARHTFEKDEVFKAMFAEGVSLLLQATEPTRRYALRNVPLEDLRDDCGYVSARHAKAELKSFYPGLTMKSEMGVIRFDFPKISGVPTVEVLDINQFEGWMRGEQEE